MAYRLVEFVLGKIKKLELAAFTRPAKKVLDKKADSHLSMIDDLVDLPELRYSKNVMHHRYHNRFDHMMLASKFAYYFATKIDADIRTCVRAAAIHDVWSKGFYYQPAVDFAKKIGETKKVQEAIATHMVLGNAPKTKEGWVVAWADECAFFVEALELMKLSIRDFIGWVAEFSPINLK